MAPGSGSDKPGFVEIFDSNGSLGRIPVPMLQMAQVEWSKDKAEIKLIGEWDFVKVTCYYWSEKQDKKIFVRK